MDGRISNQFPKRAMRLDGSQTGPLCECCSKLIDFPQRTHVELKDKFGDNCHYIIYGYHPETGFWIYPSSSGYSVVYCSRYCRDKHNHRFNR